MVKTAGSPRQGFLCDVPGLRIGHSHDFSARTGCTVILPDRPVCAGVDVRGFAPGSRELILLDPLKSVQEIHAVLLTGGSAFGLAAATGVVDYLEKRNIGFDTGVARVPIVPAAVIYDLATGDATIRPDVKMGFAACENAVVDDLTQGQFGAGTGATIGKLTGMESACAGGIGQASGQLDGGCVVAALAVVNALGDVVDAASGQIIAGARDKQTGQFIDSLAWLKANAATLKKLWGNTTLAVVATNARLNKVQATKVAQMAHDGFARCIRPVHTKFDGDTIFALSCGEIEIDEMVVGAVAAEIVAQAVVNAARVANNK